MTEGPRASIADDWLAVEGEQASVVRRAPFADSPFVGKRGQQSRQRILQTALQQFGELGYHDTGVKRITQVSGCSRAAFYQYFSSKEDLFRQLSGIVARLLADLTENVAPITPDQAGHDALRSWIDGYRAMYERYAPVFVTFQSAAASDEAVASGGARVAVRTFSVLRSRIGGSRLTSRQLDGITRTLPEVTARVCGLEQLLRSTGMGDDLLADGRVSRAVTDVFHRALFAPDAAVNVHASPAGGTPRPDPEAEIPGALADQELAGDPSLGEGARRTRSEILKAGHAVFTELGYYLSRVDDIVERAGVSHGIFYRYFDNKSHLFRLLAEQNSARFTASIAAVPALVSPKGKAIGPADLRRWLDEYADTRKDEAAIRAMWTEAISRDPALRTVSAALTERYRMGCARLLAPRRFGDHDAEAVVLMMLLDGMITPRPTAGRLETAAVVADRGLLTGPA